MKMITRCPACTTLFKVVPDQLRVAGGWVRCGQCMAVFDAQTYMQPADADAPRDSHWSEEFDLSAGAAPSGFAAVDATDTLERTAADKAVRASAADWDSDPGAEAVPAPRAEPGVTPAPEPVFAIPPVPFAPQSAPTSLPPSAPVFRSVPTDPVSPLPAPVVVRMPPAAPRPGPAPGEVAATVQSASLIPTRDDLDQRHAKLMEALVRLREVPESKHKDRNKSTGTTPSGETDRGAGHDTGEVRHRDAAAERKRKHESDARRAERTREQEAEAQESRPMIDFVLSEIGGREIAPAPARSASAIFWGETEPEAEPAVEQITPSFIEQARRRAFWARVGAGMWVGAALLTLLLAAQVAMSAREWLTAHYPPVKPLLTTLCRCRIGPWRHLDTVVLESSNFVRTGPGRFDFAVTLRNSGAVPVAMPALELMLTDVQDQTLVRRVLNPADWGAPPQLAAHGEFNGAAALAVQAEGNPQAISNYRIAVFYP
ncbi:MAG: zinc-ribbon domain-containing protein [Burkholderiaceae bacterium]|jgi:predicted Zn finger-like uncharacterized protein|nr:zinc-ribbon domain-containing protein [Burkholderiaceae bacterium]